MKNNLKIKSYRPLHQLPFCCVPAILQWILYRRKLDILDQETIGAKLGLRIPRKFSQYFSNKKIKILKDESSEFGTQILKKKYSINKFFDMCNIPLELSKEYRFNNRAELKKFILDNLKENQDIILRYNNKIFKKKNEPSVGHFSLIVECDKKKEVVLIGDPEPPFFKKTTLEKLLFSISSEIDGIKRGLYIVKNKKPESYCSNPDRDNKK